MKQIEIITKKTARYFIAGEINQNIKHVWFVCHGYGYLADRFLKWFDPINSQDTLIVSPEGLHRFYWDQKTGKVGASWMTKEERLSDIKDYVHYLDQVANEILPRLNSPQINILGFSQGAATASRWIGMGNIKPNNIIFWAGSFPEDMDNELQLEKIRSRNIIYLLGDEDEYIDEKKVEFIQNTLNSRGIKPHIINYEGGHKIYEAPLLLLNNLIRSY